MKAMVLNRLSNLGQNTTPLELANVPDPVPKQDEILVRVSACGVCHTELDEIEGRTPPPHLPIILGHQVVGKVERSGAKASRFTAGDRVGVAWIYSACGQCSFCRAGNENLCHNFQATGRDAHGGYAELMTIREGFAYEIPAVFTDTEAAPLLCAGAIGYRSLKSTGLMDGQNLGLTGFGASAHLVLKLARYQYPNSQVFVFARSESERNFARELGAVWTGSNEEESPEKLHCVIDTTPVWQPILEALKNLDSGGRLVINAIRKEDADKKVLLELEYSRHLWMEKEIKSVANVTRSDVAEFLSLAAGIGIKPELEEYRLEEANVALSELKARKVHGAKVLRIDR
jgi:propanol-preferring alcohol dehydrogenase